MPSARVTTAAEQVAEALEVYGPPAPDPEATMARPRLLLPPNLAALAKPAGDAWRHVLQGVHFTSTQEGYRAEATNGKYLGVVSGPMPDDPADFSSWGGLENAPAGAARALIPAAS
jgi:hypothetical protein